MKKLKKVFLRYHHIIPLLVYCAIYLAWFAKLEKMVTKHYHVVHVSLDDYIPFVEVFIIPYLLWFVYIAVVVGYFFFKDKDDYYKTCIFLGTGMTVFLIVSTFWPNGHHLRLAEMPRDNIFTRMIAALWQTDTATNIVPSIHVYNSIGAHLAIVKSKHFANHRGIRCASLILCVSIILSTVFIKQHSVFDMITAFIMATVMYILVYRTDILASYKVKVHSRKNKPQVG